MGEKITKDKLKPKRSNFVRWFWKGVWILPFSLAMTLTMYFAAFLTFGTTAVLTQRFKAAVGLTFVASVVMLVLALAGGGWAQEQADKRVKG